jgi:hypothetical protein
MNWPAGRMLETGCGSQAAVSRRGTAGCRPAARRQGAHDLPVLESDAREHRDQAAGEWEAGGRWSKIAARLASQK